MLKSPPADVGKARDVSLMPESGRSPGGGHGNPLRCSCLENPVDRGAWWATAHGTTESGATKAAEHACVRADTKRKEKKRGERKAGFGRRAVKPQKEAHSREPQIRGP